MGFNGSDLGFNNPAAAAGDRVDWLQLLFSEADGTAGDPNSIEITPIADGASGITAAVSGGIAYTNPADGLFQTWKLRDGNKNLLTGDLLGAVAASTLHHSVILSEKTSPGLTSGGIVSIGICDRADLSDSANALFISFISLGGNRVSRVGVLDAGIFAASTESVPDNLSLKMLGTADRNIGGGARNHAVLGITSGNTISTTQGAIRIDTLSLGGSSQLYAFISFHTEDTTAGTKTFEYYAGVSATSPTSGLAV